jgi:hypothetical protein
VPPCRSEHSERWLARREPDATISVEKLSELAHAWWEDRLSADWRPHTRDGNQAILDRLGLTGAFLTPNRMTAPPHSMKSCFSGCYSGTDR